MHPWGLRRSRKGRSPSLVSSPALRRFFEFGPLAWIGRISYGIYLWHIVIFGMLPRLKWPLGPFTWPAVFLLTIAVAAASFYALERPIPRFKRRYERVASAPPASP